MNGVQWFQLSVKETLTALKTDSTRGLTSKEAQIRLAQVGSNLLKEKRKVSPLEIFLAQFTDFMVLVLLAATAISGLLGEYADAITIMAIVIVNAVLGFVQEYKAEKSMEALKKLSAPQAKVLRDGQQISIKAEDLVPGDIVILDTGDRVPADARLLTVVNLEVEESTLTGESVPVKKSTQVLQESSLSLADRKNMVHMGTVITRGRATAAVVATGMNTEMGQIADMIQEVEVEETPLQKRLAQLGRWLVFFCLAVCAMVVGTGIMRGEPVYRMFLAGVSLAVAAIPEGLPAIVTVALAIGVQKMIKRHAIIRRLPAVETLGCATVICSDKTGTITENEMTVREIYWNKKRIHVSGQGYEPKGLFSAGERKIEIKENPTLITLFTIAALCNNAALRKNRLGIKGWWRKGVSEGQWNVVGDPTEGALLVMAAKAGIWREHVEKHEKRVAEIPFDSERKRMSVVYQSKDGRYKAYVKGAPDVIISRCQHIWENGKAVPLTKEKQEQILHENARMAGQALRVLALAYRDLSDHELQDQSFEERLVFCGLVGMIDPPRPAAVDAIQVCRQAGIKPVMITGDHQITAEAIARELGLVSGPGQVITGHQLDNISDQELEHRVDEIAVYARVSPKHKLRIVRALKRRGHVVAMTGDGVNDAPAVKEADIGISMGKMGTDVTKEASAMVLADDNFATIVAAIEEGRAIYDNIRKFIRYLLSCNVGEVLTMFVAALAGLPLPLLPIQILWVNLVTDGLPAMALGVDNADPDIMLRKPRRPQESIFAHGLARKIITRGLQIGLGTVFIFIAGLLLGEGQQGLNIARTMAFSTLVFSQLFHVFDCKSERYSVFQVGVLSNPFLVGAVLCSVAMQVLVIYLPFLQTVFKTVPLTGFHWLLIVLVAGWKTFLNAAFYCLVRPVSRCLAMLRV